MLDSNLARMYGGPVNKLEDSRAVTEIEIIPVLNQIVDTLVAKARPEKIVLFGSHAEGTAGENSDLDLLVIWNPEADLPKRARRIILRTILHEFAVIPKDILTYTTKELTEILKEPNSFTAQIFRSGRILYENSVAPSVVEDMLKSTSGVHFS